MPLKIKSKNRERVEREREREQLNWPPSDREDYVK